MEDIFYFVHYYVWFMTSLLLPVLQLRSCYSSNSNFLSVSTILVRYAMHFIFSLICPNHCPTRVVYMGRHILNLSVNKSAIFTSKQNFQTLNVFGVMRHTDKTDAIHVLYQVYIQILLQRAIVKILCPSSPAYRAILLTLESFEGRLEIFLPS